MSEDGTALATKNVSALVSATNARAFEVTVSTHAEQTSASADWCGLCSFNVLFSFVSRLRLAIVSTNRRMPVMFEGVSGLTVPVCVILELSLHHRRHRTINMQHDIATGGAQHSASARRAALGTRLREHASWWAGFWDRSHINITSVDPKVRGSVEQLTQQYAVCRCVPIFTRSSITALLLSKVVCHL